MLSRGNMAVAHGEETDTLAAFVEGKIQQWLMNGRISSLEDKWGIPNNPQVAALENLWGSGRCVPAARASLSASVWAIKHSQPRRRAIQSQPGPTRLRKPRA